MPSPKIYLWKLISRILRKGSRLFIAGAKKDRAPRTTKRMLSKVDGATSEYRVTLAHEDDKNRDVFLLTVEGEGRVSFEEMSKKISEIFKTYVGVTPRVSIVPVGTMPRSEKKTKRVTDYRE